MTIRAEKEGTDRSRAEPRMQTFGTTGRAGNELSRRHSRVPPFRHPEVFLSTAPALPSIQILCSVRETAGREAAWPSCWGAQGQVAGRAGSPRRECPPPPRDKTSKCFTNNRSGPLPKSCPGSRTLGGGVCLATKNLVLPPTRVNANPWATYLLSLKGKSGPGRFKLL